MDSLLVISKVISAMIRGLNEIGQGLLNLLVGLAKLVWSVVRIRPPDRPER